VSKTTDVIVDNHGNGAQQQKELNADSSIVSWVMNRVTDWEDHRKQNFDARWDEYYRMWRGIWASTDKSRKSERSKLIHPALSQAVDDAVAEIEEATFGQGKWFDVSDNFIDENPADIKMWRDQLNEDFEKEDIVSSMSEVFLNGALYGTGIGKIVVEERTEKQIKPRPIGDTTVTTVDTVEGKTVRIYIKPIHPKEFVIDPTTCNIQEALGMAHITEVPKHTVQRLQAQGVYRETVISGYTDTIVGGQHQSDKGEIQDLREEDKTMIIEYHGFVPRKLLKGFEEQGSVDGDPESIELMDDDDLVEAIVTIGNSTTLLRAIENPYVMGDRCFLAYQHDKVPNRFWGRGVCEKGYNPQKGLDAEMRGRIDAMALSIHPMMAMDATRLMRGADLGVAPGKNILTNGDPKDILMPFNFGQVNPTTFSQSADLERQVQMATGSMDSATPIGDNRRNETMGGMSMIQGGSRKRIKKTLRNIELQFTQPFIHKAAWRYMQFAPDRYPIQDIQFNAHATLSIAAREHEQAQLANMLKTVPAESPAFWMLLKGIYEHSDLSNREEMLEIIGQMMQQSLQKQAQPEPDPLVQIKMKEIEVEAQLEQAKLQQKADKDNKDLQVDIQKLQLEAQKLALKREEIILDARIALAGQEQDSFVTATQMRVSEEDNIRKAVVQLSKAK